MFSALSHNYNSLLPSTKRVPYSTCFSSPLRVSRMRMKLCLRIRPMNIYVLSVMILGVSLSALLSYLPLPPQYCRGRGQHTYPISLKPLLDNPLIGFFHSESPE